MKAIRGAIALQEDTYLELERRVLQLVGEIMSMNHVDSDEIVSIVFTCTKDIRSGFPATVVRHHIDAVPMLDTQHMDIDGAMSKVVRAMVTLDRDRASAVHHVYLNGAELLRPDLDPIQ